MPPHVVLELVAVDRRGGLKSRGAGGRHAPCPGRRGHVPRDASCAPPPANGATAVAASEVAVVLMFITNLCTSYKF